MSKQTKKARWIAQNFDGEISVIWSTYRHGRTSWGYYDHRKWYISGEYHNRFILPDLPDLLFNLAAKIAKSLNKERVTPAKMKRLWKTLIK